MSNTPDPITASAQHSRFVQRIRRRYAADLGALPPGLPDAAGITALVHTLQAQGRSWQAALRVTRQLVLERLAVLDVEHGASLGEVTGCMTHLAEATLEIALALADAEASARYGEPLGAQGQRLALWIVGMGKLGARELNVSSDIDLVYVYEDAGTAPGAAPGAADPLTTGPQPVSLHEYFSWVAKRLFALIGETTEDGFVFRMDLALRPNGNSGPPVVSLAMLDSYFQAQGREWERFAWLKSRVVAPRAAVTSGQALALRGLVAPFVYRRYLDYGVFEGLRQLHRKVREDAQRRAMGRPERGNDVKLSRGGIREIEFTVQLMLVVRGGQFPEIRTRSTLRGLQHLTQQGLIKPATAQALAAGYVFLRHLEHRIQYLDDQQTHLLPTVDADLAWIASSLHPPLLTSELLQQLGDVRELVAGEFDALLHEGRPPAALGQTFGQTVGQTFNPTAGTSSGEQAQATALCRACGPAPLPVDSAALVDGLPAALAERLRPWASAPRVLALRDTSRLRLGRLMQKTGLALVQADCTESAALRFVDWIEPLMKRENYLALLLERPEVHRRLLRLLGLARWPMQYLMRHPGVIDELADERLLHQRFDPAAFTTELQLRLAGWQRSGEDIEERLLDTLRHAHHAEVFRTLVRDVEGVLTVEEVADDLSSLADTVLALVLQWAWARLKQRHHEVPEFAVIAYGKLGGKELGYGSDLDVVFVYGQAAAQAATDVLPDQADAADRDQESDQEIYAAFARKLITWLTLRTAAGELFDIDTALRPNGSSGLLVSSIGAFEHYQVGRGSNTAWAWEHQALTRARWVAGSPQLAARFEATRRQVLAAPRDAEQLREQVRTMRERVRAAHPVPAHLFDVKHSPGGMMDVEFAVQYLVLVHSAAHPALQDNAGNIALLQRAQAAGLLPSGVGDAAAQAYRNLRRVQHQARLDEKPTQVPPPQMQTEIAAVLELWQLVMLSVAA
jgi:[glutamine synthetase] adenylyltransferase / [glutamine synthetase]-adenylyl-L-tyrosine phosphorylase